LSLIQAVGKPEFLRYCFNQEALRISVYAVVSWFQHASNFKFLNSLSSCWLCQQSGSRALLLIFFILEYLCPFLN